MNPVKRQILRRLPLARLFLIPYRARLPIKHLLPRIGNACSWLLNSRETTNLTYELTDRNVEHLAHVVSVAIRRPAREIRSLFDEVFSDEELSKVLRLQSSAPSYRVVSDPQLRPGRRLAWYAVVRSVRPRVVIESGVEKGLGALLICAALMRNTMEGHGGRYYGIDIDPEAGLLLAGSFREHGTLICGDSIESLRSFDVIDVFIQDCDHSRDYEFRELEALKTHLNSGSIIISDNSRNTDALMDFARREGKDFLFFQEEPRQTWHSGEGMGICF